MMIVNNNKTDGLEKQELPYFSFDVSLPLHPRLSSLPKDCIQHLFALLETSLSTTPTSFLDSLAKASLLKCVTVLSRQMEFITLPQQSSLLKQLETQSILATSTPGEIVAPFISSVVLSAMFNRYFYVRLGRMTSL